MDRVSGIKSSQTSVSLLPPKLDAFTEEDLLEKELKTFISDHRKSQAMTCKFDDKLSNMLLPALANYELERTTGATFGQEEFQNSIKMYIPDNHTFKAFPIQFNHRNAKTIFDTLVHAPVRILSLIS